MVSYNELGGNPSDFVDLGGIRLDPHSFCHRRIAGSYKAPAFDLDHTKPTYADRFQVRMIADVRNVYFVFKSSLKNCFIFARGNLLAINR